METLIFTIVTSDKTVILDGQTALNVDMVGIPSNISAVQWLGDSGWIEFFSDLETGLRPSNESISSYDAYQPQLEQAAEIIANDEEILYALNNPKIYYRTVAPLGEQIQVNTPGWPQPEDTTEIPPPESPALNCTLYWSDADWVWSPFPVDDTLDEAKAYICQKIDKSAYGILVSSDWMVVRQSETGVPIAAEWSSWRETIREEALEKKATADGETSLEDLYAYAISPEYFAWTEPPA